MPTIEYTFSNEYTCDGCGRQYTHGWSEQEAVAECIRHFGVAPKDAADVVLLCDDCYNDYMRKISATN